MKTVITSILPLIVCILLFADCASDSSTENTTASETAEQTAGSEAATEEVSIDRDGMRAAYREILTENLEAMSAESIAANKGSQMTALFDIDGDSVEELFAYYPKKIFW